MKYTVCLVALLTACRNPDLIGDSDRPFDPDVGEFNSNSWGGGDDGIEPSLNRLSLTMEGLVLQIEHIQLYFDCEVEFVNELSIEGNQVTMNYTNTPMTTSCPFDLSYSVDFSEQDLSPGEYVYNAEDDSDTFVIPNE